MVRHSSEPAGAVLKEIPGDRNREVVPESARYESHNA